MNDRKKMFGQHLISSRPFEDLVGEDVLAVILKQAPRKVLSRVQKSLDHFGKAIRLIGVDDEMGAIRCIAAEEELVVAVFEWLKLNSEKVPKHEDFIRKFKNHNVKLAFYPVLSQFRFVLGETLEHGCSLDGLDDVLRISVAAVCKNEKVRLSLTNDGGEELLLFNPLNVAVSREDSTDEKVVDDLYNDFSKLIADQRGMTVKEFVSARADYRNKILYAEDGGAAMMDDDLKDLIETVFSKSLHDLLWCLAALLTNDPLIKEWGLVSQFISLYRRVLIEAKLIDPPAAHGTKSPEA